MIFAALFLIGLAYLWTRAIERTQHQEIPPWPEEWPY